MASRKQLTEVAIREIRNSLPMQGEISKALAAYRKNEEPISPSTMRRYLKDNEPMLALNDEVIEIIKNHTGMKEEEIVEHVPTVDTTTVM